MFVFTVQCVNSWRQEDTLGVNNENPSVPSFLFPADLVMGDESSLSRQIGSVERSVVFLRQEHLTLLHGLHLEILSLQKRCSGEGHAAATAAAAVAEQAEKLLPDPTFLACSICSSSL